MRRLQNFVQAILLTLVINLVAIDNRESPNPQADDRPIKHPNGLNPMTIDPDANLKHYNSIDDVPLWHSNITDLLNASLFDTQLGKGVKRYDERQQ